MRKQMMLLAILMMCLPVSSILAGSNYYDYSYARMSYVQGDVFIQRADDLGYEEGVVNLGLIQGDKLGTRDGKTEIHLGRRNYLRVNHYTQLDIVELPNQYDYRVQLHLLSGEIFLRVNYLEKEKDIEIHTPDASYYIVENGLYRVHVRDNLETELRVLSGAVEAAAEEGSLLVYAEESLQAANGRFMNDPVSLRAGWNDSFYEWNQSRESLHSRRVDRHYLPSDLNDYESELAYYGDWVHEGSFGHVWVPRTISSSWRPYWNGRWVWYPVIGWTWVSYEPWGWCVSHYGRWHWSGRLGWYWIPTRTWGPAWVHWYHGSHYVGWSPLSYWGHPGVVINNHYYGRYYRDSYPLHSRALTMVHRDQLQASRISRVSLNHTQVRKSVNKISLSSRQPDIRPAVNRDSARTRIAAGALERSKTRTVKGTFSSGGTGAARSRVDASRIRSSGDAARVSGSKSRVSQSAPGRKSVSRNENTKARGSVSRSGTASRGGVERIKTYPSQRERSSRYLGTDRRSRAGTDRSSSRERVITGASARSSRAKSSGSTEESGRIKRYSPSSRSSGRTSRIKSNERSSLNRNSAVSSRERRNVSSSRTILNNKRSSRYITGRSASPVRGQSASSRRNVSSRSSGNIRNRSSSVRARPSPSRRSPSVSRSSSRISSPRSSISSSRTKSSRTSGRSISRVSRSRSSRTSGRKSSSRSSGTKKRKK